MTARLYEPMSPSNAGADKFKAFLDQLTSHTAASENQLSCLSAQALDSLATIDKLREELAVNGSALNAALHREQQLKTALRSSIDATTMLADVKISAQWRLAPATVIDASGTFAAIRDAVRAELAVQHAAQLQSLKDELSVRDAEISGLRTSVRLLQNDKDALCETKDQLLRLLKEQQLQLAQSTASRLIPHEPERNALATIPPMGR